MKRINIETTHSGTNFGELEDGEFFIDGDGDLLFKGDSFDGEGNAVVVIEGGQFNHKKQAFGYFIADEDEVTRVVLKSVNVAVALSGKAEGDE